MAEQFKQFAKMAAMFGTSWATPQVNKGWLCHCSDCVYAVKGYKNYAERTHCHGCFRPRAKAQHPPEELAMAKDIDNHNNDPVKKEPNTKEAKKREARARKRAARETARASTTGTTPTPASVTTPAPVQAPGPVASAMAQASTPAPTVTRIKLKEETTSKLIFLLPSAADKIVTSLAQEVVPGPVEPKCAATIMGQFIGERGPTAKTARTLKLENLISKLKMAITSLQGPGDSMKDVIEGMQAKVEASEKELARINKDAPSMDHERMAVAEARSSYEVSMQARLDRAARGASKAEERQDARLERINALKGEITILEEAVTKCYIENTIKHKERAQAAAELDKQVLAAFDQQLADLVGAQPMDGAA